MGHCASTSPSHRCWSAEMSFNTLKISPRCHHCSSTIVRQSIAKLLPQMALYGFFALSWNVIYPLPLPPCYQHVLFARNCVGQSTPMTWLTKAWNLGVAMIVTFHSLHPYINTEGTLSRRTSTLCWYWSIYIFRVGRKRRKQIKDIGKHRARCHHHQI